MPLAAVVAQEHKGAMACQAWLVEVAASASRALLPARCIITVVVVVLEHTRQLRQMLLRVLAGLLVAVTVEV
jgi:hypothetical protein